MEWRGGRSTREGEEGRQEEKEGRRERKRGMTEEREEGGIEVSGQRQMKTRTSQICTAYFHRTGCELDIEFTNLHFSFIKHSNQVPWNEVSKTLQSLEEDI